MANKVNLAWTRRGVLATATALVLGVYGSATFSADTVEPKKGGTLIYLEQQAHHNLYPPAGGFYPNGGVLNQITDKLTYQNPETLEIEPWIAESWTVNDTATEYTFKLRSGVTFSDGTPVDAAAVAKNYDTFGLGNKELKQPVSEVINNYERSEVLDPLTVKFYFSAPSPGFLQGTSVIGSGLVSLATLARPFEELGDATKIIGSGPFVVESEKPGKEWVFKARKDYNWGPTKLAHQGPAYLDRIRVVVTGEDGVRIGALLSGQAQFIRQLQAYDEKRVKDQNFPIYAPGTRGVNNQVAFRPDNELVADIRVRKALLHATNTKEIVQTLFSANYPVATSVIAQNAAGYVNQAEKLQYDPEQAARLLDEAGWKSGANGLREKDGRTLELSAYFSPPQPQNKETLQLLAQQWAKLGVKFNVLSSDAGSRTLENLDPQKHQSHLPWLAALTQMWSRASITPLTAMPCCKGGVSQHVKSFEDSKLNGLFDAIAAETDRTKRLQLVGQVQEYLIDQAYVIPIFEEPQVFAGSPKLKGVSFEAVGRPSFYSAWLDK